MSAIVRRPPAWRVSLLVGLLAATVLLASLLAYEASRSVRSERVTAERVLHDYATMAMWELESAARKKLDVVLNAAFGAVTAGVANSPFEVAPPVDVFRSSAGDAFRCGAGAADEGTYVAVDLRAGSFTAIPADAPEAPLLAAAAQRFVRDAKLESPVGISFTALNDRRRIAAFGVRYARQGSPLAAYALSTCATALGAPFFAEVLRTHPLLPAAGAATPNDSLFTVALVTPGADTSFVTRRAPASLSASAPIDGWGGVRLSVGIRADAAALLVRPPATSRVPLLLSLLVLAAGLAVVAVWQIRREHELARLRADFTGSVSHELRTPLAQILLFGETLSLNRTRSGEEQRFAANTIVREARRLMHIVDTLLAFSDERRVVRSRPHPMLLEPLVREIVGAFTPLARAEGATLEVETNERTVAMADPDALRQIVLNLLDNAIKYGPPGQRVVIRLWTEGGRVRLAVDDEGPGIMPRERERVWRPYVRLRHPGNTSGRAAGGSGIGLAVVRELAESLGARVWVEDAPRGGARFVVDLAAAELPPAGAPPAGNMLPPPGESHNPAIAADSMATHAATPRIPT